MARNFTEEEGRFEILGFEISKGKGMETDGLGDFRFAIFDCFGTTRTESEVSEILIGSDGRMRLISIMPTLEQIENDVKQLTKADQEALKDWLEDVLEDQLEFTDEFKAKIERGERDIREGRIRVRTV